jgi:hypothetical protein
MSSSQSELTPTPDGAFLEKVENPIEAMLWFVEGLKITDPLKRLDYWEDHPKRFAFVNGLVVPEFSDMRTLATNLKEHHEVMAKIHGRATGLDKALSQLP